ncbi:hypothetical protein, partial [Pseudomonas juntendi]
QGGRARLSQALLARNKRRSERSSRCAARAALDLTGAEDAPATTFVSGQLFLWDLRANALAHASKSRRTNKAAARACHRRYWPETNVGASAARDAPRGRRSISQALKMQRLPLPGTI